MMRVSKPCILAALFFLLLYSFKLGYSIGNNGVIVCREIEKQSLSNFKQSLQDPDNMLSSWNVEVDCCKWKGVICSNLTGHVHQLHLQGLHGKINPCLLNLKHLKYLDLGQNNFEETIPSFIGSLTSLEYLNLSYAGFYGKIPHNIGNLSSLHTLDLHENSLDVDKLEWLSRLSKLEYLNMNFVDLSKVANWAQVIDKLSSLVQLHLCSCGLTNNSRAPMNNVNITSNLAILDLSMNYFQSSAILKWIFRLNNLIYLDLSVNSFEGPIPSNSNATKLQHIDLSFNNFTSIIPEWLYICKDLEFFEMGFNHLQNAISNSIGNLTSLNTLDLSNNELSGKIPREIANLCKLQNLDLSKNKLQGEISDSFGNMSDCFLRALESLYLNENQLSGHLTHQFGEFRSVGNLNLWRNSLTGVIPSNIGNLSFLEYLNLGGNKLNENLPESVGQLFNLKVLHIQDNMLEGVVTETHFAHLSKLKTLYASENQLTLKVSPNWIPPFKLTRLVLRSWNLNLGSRIPPWLETQKKNIQVLDLSCTGIFGNVPSWLWSIGFLNLSHNQLHGKIPVISGRGQVAHLSSNKFSGPLPRIGNTVTELDLSNNSFSGDISHFLCDTTTNETYQLEILHLGGNHLTGKLLDCWMKLPLLRVLNLGNNNLSGRIPNSIGFLAHLQSLNLYGNNFSGQIPFSMLNCTYLVMMDLAHNNFDGSLPTWIGTSLFELKFLILRSNKLSGEITPSICQLSSLQIMDLSDNKFSGIIPRCIDNFTAMATKRSLPFDVYGDTKFEYSYYWRELLESASITTKGSELHYDTILLLVTNIDLSKNNLSGDIPKEITNLVELRSLNLSRNHLTGLIPNSIGNMKQLESLDFSINSLSGELPDSFTAMSSLNYLNLSYNNLTGMIPESTQLRGFNDSSFIGNNLCGPPLTISCRNDGKASGPTNAKDQDQEGDKSKIEWLYVFISLGYAVGLSGFFTTLFLKKSWREAYYEFLEDMWDSFYVYFYIKWRRLRRALGRNP